ncbi:MAG: DUF3596 domain-containing protein [Comamonas sp.]
MDQKPALATPPGVTIRVKATVTRIQIAFTWQGMQCRELLPPCPISKASIQYAANLRGEILRKIKDGTFAYPDYFPSSPKAKAPDPQSSLMQEMLGQANGALREAGRKRENVAGDFSRLRQEPHR